MIPDYQSLMLPLMRITSDGKEHFNERNKREPRDDFQSDRR